VTKIRQILKAKILKRLKQEIKTLSFLSIHVQKLTMNSFIANFNAHQQTREQCVDVKTFKRDKEILKTHFL